MLKKLITFGKLPWEEKKCFFHALLFQYRYRLKLKNVPLDILLLMVEKESAIHKDKKTSYLSVKRIERIVKIAASLTPFSTCLSEALAGQVLFLSNNHSTKLHFGVRNTEGEGFEAHAWLSLEREIVLGDLPDLASYKEFPPLSARHKK